jgi:hypothetical protein
VNHLLSILIQSLGALTRATKRGVGGRRSSTLNRVALKGLL